VKVAIVWLAIAIFQGKASGFDLRRLKGISHRFNCSSEKLKMLCISVS